MRPRNAILLALITLVAPSTVEGAVEAPVLYGLGNTDLGAARTRSFLYTIDTSTGAATLVGDTGFNLRGLAHNPLTGRFYASRAEHNGGVGGLYEIDPGTGAATLIGGTQNFSEMEFDSFGNLFGYGDRRESNHYNYYSIDVSTGVGTVLNSNAIDGFNHAVFGIAYSSADDETYYYQQWLNGRDGEGLSTVDLANGTLTLVATGPRHFSSRPDIAADDGG